MGNTLKLVGCIGLATLVTLGCKKSTENNTPPTPSGSTTTSSAVASATAKQPEGPPTFTFEGHELKFAYAWVYEANGPVIRLSTHAHECGGGNLPDEAQTLDITIGAGPGLKHYGGKPTTARIEFFPQKTNLELKNTTFSGVDAPVVNLEPFKYETDQHIKGTIRLEELKKKADEKMLTYVGGGKFDAVICSAGDSGLQSFDEKAPDGPVAFNVGGKAFTAKAAIATVMHDNDSNTDAITNVRFFDVDGVTCDNANGFEGKATIIRFDGFGGTSSRQKLTGSPVQSEMSLYKATPKNNYVSFSGAGGGGGGWIQFDSLSFDKESKVKGQVVGLSDRFAKPGDKTTVGGHFEATVCPW